MSTNILRRHPSTPPGPPPHRRRAAPGPWTSSSGRSGFQSEIRYLIPRCETSQSFCGPWALLPAARGRLPADGALWQQSALLTAEAGSSSLTVASAASDPYPGSGDPYRVNVGGGDVCTGHPDILDAVPAPVTRLPDIYPGLGGAGTASTTGAGGAMPTTTPTRARPGTAVRVRAAAQRNGMIARRLMAGSWEGLRVRRTVYRLGRVGALTAVNNFPAVRFSQASAVTDLMPVGSHRAAGGLHAVLRQSRTGPA